MRRYGEWAGNTEGRPEKLTKCVVEVSTYGSMIYHQCSRDRGYGPHKDLCKQHAKMSKEGRHLNIPREDIP